MRTRELRAGITTPENTKQELTRQETAAYIADVALQLRNLARQADMKFLTYLLEMVFQEAFSESGEKRDKR